MVNGYGISLFDMCKEEREKQIMRNVDVHDEVRLLLIRLGVLPVLTGYDYLMLAILLSIANRDYLRHVTTKMYPTIAKKFGVEPSVVERNIRHAINVTATRGKLKYLNDYLGVEAFSDRDRPTNAEFISVIADKVSFDLTRKSAL